jgi:eukaryotic-like serine/threonine-protein kinase
MAQKRGPLVAAAILGVLLLSGILAATTGWRAWTGHPPVDPVGSAPPTEQPTAPTRPSTPKATPTTGKRAPDDPAVKNANARLVDAYLFFLAAFNSHHARGQ